MVSSGIINVIYWVQNLKIRAGTLQGEQHGITVLHINQLVHKKLDSFCGY